MARKPFPATASSIPARADFWLTRAARSRTDQFEDEPRSAAGPMRVSLRRRTAFTATLNYGLTYSVPHQVRDLSPSDAFVEIESPDFAVGTSVEFVLRCRFRDTPVELRIAASVVRVERDGVALHFRPYDDETYTSLVKLLYCT